MPASNGHILIVEDDADLLEVLKFVLEDEGFEVTTTDRGAEAFSLAAAQEFALVLLDVSMPDIDGIELATQLRADPRTRHLRLAIHTGLAAADIRERFTDYDAFIAKAEEADELIAAIRAAVAQPMRPRSPPPSANTAPEAEARRVPIADASPAP
jgi:CheY-like chemotaxis protein